MYIKVLVAAKSKKEIFIQKSENSFVAQIKEPAERNLANRRVVELVAGHYKITENRVRIVNGHHHPSKLLSVDID
ncbi:DUF167 domain-containing protein [Candidatus Parcubacteria bacterium]|nr:DUF167 domain-containing protein [Candidatus Parcubacteria bacterium]